MSKKILVFSLAYYPSFVSGAEGAIKEITDRISPEKIEFHMVTHLFEKGAPREEKIGNVHVHRVGFGNAYLSKILFVPLAALKARSLHKSIGIDALWAMMTYMLFPLVLARCIGVKKPYVLTLQDGDPYEKVFSRPFIKPFTPILDYGFRHANLIQVISKYLGEWPKMRGYNGEVVTVRNGANPKNLHNPYSEEELIEVREELGKKEGDVYLFIAARLVYQKAIDSVIRALPLLPKHVHFLIAGGGEDEAMLRALTKELQLEDRVRFLGALERDDVPKYRNTIVSDIFVHPSRSEGLGNTVLSAMAAKLPVIATQVGGFEDYIFDEKRNPEREPTAWAVDVDAPEQIAAAVHDIMVNKEKVARTTNIARRMVEEEYNWDLIGTKMQHEVFERILK